jgi:hypothetical protein
MRFLVASSSWATVWPNSGTRKIGS